MGNLSFAGQARMDEMKLKWLVIPFDPPVQVAACSIVSLALISIKAVRHSGARAKRANPEDRDNWREIPGSC
jgi:hypothetical protein